MRMRLSHITFSMLMWLLVAATFVSCRPRGILHSWEMREVLIDLHKTDALLQIHGIKTGNEEAKRIYYAQVLERHGITQAEFDSSLVWYTAHPKLFDKIYPKVLAQLDAEEAEFMALYGDQLTFENTPVRDKKKPFYRSHMDSVLWVSINGYPSTWQPLPNNYYGPKVQ